jgi:endonuclease-8
MPEGPSIVILKEEVQSFKRKKILRVSGNSRIDISKLVGQQVVDFKSWGKHFIICFENFYLRIHLLMFGSYRINEKKEALPRLHMEFENGELNFYACSIKMIEGDVNSFYDWKTDIMSDKWDPGKAFKSIQKLKDNMVCDILLNQEIFSGVGNIIKNEVLFLTKVHPETLVKYLSKKKVKEIIEVARDYCFDFYKWKKAFVLRKHWLVYRSRICPRCEIPLIIRHTGKGDRRSFFCDNCQLLYKN